MVDLIAGSTVTGHVDEIFTGAQFSDITAIASDGEYLYVSDASASANWLRKVRGVKLPTDPGGPSAGGTGTAAPTAHRSMRRREGETADGTRTTTSICTTSGRRLGQ